ncbi:MAG TPA: LptF/LptG family permease [Caulobacteraceae bacterium]|nr:LptF/LptG family permease [Caulobacteraceae bacterium]
MLFRYLSVMLLKRTLATLAVLVALLQLVDLFDATSQVLERGLGLGGIVHYELLRTPGMIEQILPVSVLIGALTCFTGLARNSEMSALRASGVTIYRIVLMMLPAAGVMAAAHFIIADQIAPLSQRAFTVWWNAHALPEKAPTDAPARSANGAPKVAPKKNKTVWFRTGPYLVYAEAAAADGRRLEGLRIYHRDALGRLDQRIVAQSAAIGADGKWRLQSAELLGVAPTKLAPAARGDRVWNTELAPSDVVSVFSPDDHISAGRALRAINGDRPADKSPAFYATRVQRALAEPLGALVMLLLAAPAALAQQRNNQTTLLLFSLAAGLLFMMVDGVLTALGQTNVLPPLLGAWAGPLLFTALAGATLVHLEG